jgi:hypothetical protein
VATATIVVAVVTVNVTATNRGTMLGLKYPPGWSN